MDYEYSVIRSRRRSLAIEITDDAGLLVRAPMRLPEREIRRFVEEKASWIDKHIEKVKERNRRTDAIEPIGRWELRDLADEALRVIPGKVEYYAGILGVTYGKITIRHQKSLWGSCSSKGNLNFNCMLMKAPGHVQDYVVVHELCHRREMNHSARFWSLVRSVIPDYEDCRKWLKEEGTIYLNKSSQQNF